MQLSNASSYIDFSRFSGMRAQATTDRHAAMADVAEEFEALFVDLMLKAARDAEIEGGMFDSNALSTYREMFDHQIALTMAHSADLGIGSAMARQLEGLLGENVSAEQDVPAGQGGLGAWPPGDELRRFSGAESGKPSDFRWQFINRLQPYAEQAARELGVSERALLAQAALETGWGRHVMRGPDGHSSNNYFGIKATAGWTGEVVTVPTTEYIDGRAVSVNGAFRAYDSPAGAFRDYVDFIADNPRYRAVLANGTNDARFAEQLAAAGYATDPRYAEKIIAIIDTVEWGDNVSPGAGDH